MSKQQFEYLRHILDEIHFLLGNSQDLNHNDFLDDEVLKRAFVRSLEIIGEAVKKLPVDVREQHTSIDWKAMAMTRDKLIHHYFGVDYDIVWDIVTHEIPQLKVAIEEILKERLLRMFEKETGFILILRQLAHLYLDAEVLYFVREENDSTEDKR